MVEVNINVFKSQALLHPASHPAHHSLRLLLLALLCRNQGYFFYATITESRKALF